MVSILSVNLVLSTLVFWIAARLYLLPKLAQLSARAVLLPILLLHSFRHRGLMFAITLATVYDAADTMGPAYWIPAFWVPALLVTHWLTFVVLRRYRPGSGRYSSADGQVEQTMAAPARH